MDDAAHTKLASADIDAAARAAAYAMPVDQIDPSDPELYVQDTWRPYFERLRKEDPVHWFESPDPDIGAFWSITRFDDILAVDTNHQVFSSKGSIVLFDPKEDFNAPMFIAMDPPKHDIQRKTVSPVVAPAQLAYMEPIIRARAAEILDDLPIGQEFDWVDKVSMELTTMTLAILFDFPWEDRRKLTRWSDVTTASAESGMLGTTDPEEHENRRRGELFECVDYFTRLWEERAKAPPKPDLISMLAHGEATKDMDRMEYLGNLMLLIVGGNDTTRNTISGSVVALNQFPEQDRILRADHAHIPNMVSETIRWQTPLAYMRRTCAQDFEIGGKTIREGDKVAMWYISGNRDETVIERPDDYWIERPRVRHHLSFGFGIHRCVGNRLAELQLKIIWEEILARFPKIELVGPPVRVHSQFVHGFERLPVVIPTRN